MDEWIRIARQLIDRYGEQKMFHQLVEWEKEHCPWVRSDSESEQKALVYGESENPFSSIRNVTSRLRKTLDYIGLGRLIRVEHKMLSLNPAYVITTDVDGFDELNRKILQARNAADPDMAVLRHLYEQVLALYQGSLLPRQDHYHWVMAKAVAYQNQYLGILNDYLELLYKERQFVEVQKIASDSLSIDVYASAMHFHLIRALLATGSKSLAKVYFRQSDKFLTDEHRRELNRLFMNAGV